MNDERFGVPPHSPQHAPDHAQKNPTPAGGNSEPGDCDSVPPAPPISVVNRFGIAGFSSAGSTRVSDEDTGSGIPVIWPDEPTTNVASAPSVLTGGSNEGADLPAIWDEKPDQGDLPIIWGDKPDQGKE